MELDDLKAACNQGKRNYLSQYYDISALEDLKKNKKLHDIQI